MKKNVKAVSKAAAAIRAIIASLLPTSHYMINFEQMRRVLSWLDTNIITLLAGFLLVFIPLYPKWPLFDVLPGYIVRARLEDILVGLTLGVFLLQILRKRVVFKLTPVTIGLITYLVIGFLSVIAAIFIVQTVPLQVLHVEKTVLHWLRRIEYFSLFFILFSSIRSAKIVKTFLILFLLTFIAVIIYGYGQKYLYWPAFSTMNREFSKGWWLYLTEHARVLSTFGGHYDLAGYLVIALTLTWSFFFGFKTKLQKFLIGIVLAGGFWLLILTASRISFIAYLVGLAVVVFLWTFKKGLGWGISRLFIATTLSIVIMLSFGDLSDRFLHLLKVYDRVEGLRKIVLKPTSAPPKDKAMFLENNLAAVTSKSDMPPTPRDVTGKEIPLFLPQITASGATILVATQRTYSQNALLFDLSTSIRLDATWPRAIAAFKADPLLGSGYATLTKTSKDEFTEAESTDNDYLRALGETGLLGFLSFFGTIVVMAWISFKSLGGIKNQFLYSLVAGFVGYTVGLLVNGTYIDIFEASKVAYVFWGMSGLTMGSIYLAREQIAKDRKPLRIPFSWSDFWQNLKKFVTSDLLWVMVICILTLSLRVYKIGTPLADWHSWRQADTSAVSRNFVKQDSFNWLYPTYDDLSSIASGKENPKGLRMVEFPLYNAVTVIVNKIAPELNIEASGRLTTGLASVASMLFIFLLCRRLLSRRTAYFAALAFALIPYDIFYGRVVLPDPSMVAASLGALWYGTKYILEEKKRYLVLSLVLGAIALLIKPFAIFLLAPLAYLWLAGFKFNPRKIFILFLWALIVVIPLVLWRFWISHFPEGIPASDWLYNGDGIRFKGAFWYWIFADRIGRLILGYWGLILLSFGLIRPFVGKFKYFPIVFFLSSIFYVFVFATGNVRHDYYQILLTPSLAILVGYGADYLWQTNWRGKALTIVSALFMLAFGWYFIKDYYNINHPEIVEAGKAMEETSNGKSLVIAPYGGDTAFLYQTNRQGWPVMEGSIENMIAKGADYYVSTNFDDLTKQLIKDSWPKDEPNPNHVLSKYTLIKYTDKYVIIQLVPNGKLPK